MRVLALLCVGIALVAARPDVSHLKKGYNYNAPSLQNVGSSFVPRFDSGSQIQEQFSSGSGSHGGNFAAQPTFSSGSQGQFSSGQGFSGSNQGSSQGLFTGGNQGFSGSSQGSSQGFSGNSQGVLQTNQGFQGGNQGGNAGTRFQSVETVASGFENENRFSGNNYQQQQNLEPIITKNFFVHAAPEERQVVQLRVIQEQARPRKNYNVIFVKTPAGPIFKAPHIQQQVQNEDKTLVYVLSNNQGQAEDIVIPAPAPAIPTKPEVFFIKYKNQQEADYKIKEIQNNYNQGNFNAQANLGSSTFQSGTSGQGLSHQTRFSDVDASGNSNSGSFVSQEQPQQSTFQSGVGLVSGLGSVSGISSGLGLGTGSGSGSGLGLVSGSVSGSGSDNVGFTSTGSADKGVSLVSTGFPVNNIGSSKQTVSTFETTSGPANSVRFSGSSDSTGANSELEYLPSN